MYINNEYIYKLLVIYIFWLENSIKIRFYANLKLICQEYICFMTPSSVTKLYNFIITITFFFLNINFIQYININIYSMMKNFLI